MRGAESPHPPPTPDLRSPKKPSPNRVKFCRKDIKLLKTLFNSSVTQSFQPILYLHKSWNITVTLAVTEAMKPKRS